MPKDKYDMNHDFVLVKIYFPHILNRYVYKYNKMSFYVTQGYAKENYFI